MTGTERIKLVEKEKLCFNCLKRNLNADKVKSKGGKFISTYALPDSGSESTLIRTDFFEDTRSGWKNKVDKYQQYKGYWRNHKSKRG